MSGGSMEHLFRLVEDASFRENTPQRRALRKHMNLLAKALKAVEWNDSCDGDSQETELLDAVLGKGAALKEAIEMAHEAQAQLAAEIGRAVSAGATQP